MLKRAMVVVLGSLVLGSSLSCLAYAQDEEPSTPQASSLTVKLQRTSGVDPAYVLDAVTSASESGKSTDPALFERLLRPNFGRWLIEYRFPEEILTRFRRDDPDNPDSHLQEFIVLYYADASATRTAYERLSTDPLFLSVGLDVGPHLSGTRPSDYYVQQVAQSDTGNYEWWAEDVEAMNKSATPSVGNGWDVARGYGYVGVVDTGIDVLHPDLQLNFRPHFAQAFYENPCSGPLWDVDELNNSASPSACHETHPGHGTHVAGIIAAQADNTIGSAGLCWYCSLIIAKANQPTANLDIGQIKGIATAINGTYHSIIRGAQIINRSGGQIDYLHVRYPSVYPTNTTCANIPVGYDGYCEVLRSGSQKDVIFVAASGNANNTSQVDFPASEPGVVSVAGLFRAVPSFRTDRLWFQDSTLSLSPGSNIGKVEFVAPARALISSIYRLYDHNLSFQCGDSVNGTFGPYLGYDQCSGTSMAAPVITGVMAVTRSVNPLQTRAAVQNNLYSTGVVAVAPSYIEPRMVQAVTAAAATNGSVTPMFALKSSSSDSDRFYTTVPQMAIAAINGTMLPVRLSTNNSPYISELSSYATGVTGYTVFPSITTTVPVAQFKLFTRFQIGGIAVSPLYRLSKLQDVGTGKDACGTAMPVSSKVDPVQHLYTTSSTEMGQFVAQVQGKCFNFDGIEGYVAPWNFGGLVELFRLYNPTVDSYMLATSTKLATAIANGFSQGQTSLGWVVPN